MTDISHDRPIAPTGNARGAFVVVTSLFFAWGFITSMIDPLVAAVKGIFSLTDLEAPPPLGSGRPFGFKWQVDMRPSWSLKPAPGVADTLFTRLI